MMNNIELIEVAKTLQTECGNKESCDDCPFFRSDEGCRINNPEEWASMDQLKKEALAEQAAVDYLKAHPEVVDEITNAMANVGSVLSEIMDELTKTVQELAEIVLSIKETEDED